MRYVKQLDLGRGRSVKLPRQDSGFFTDARQSGMGRQESLSLWNSDQMTRLTAVGQLRT